MGFLGSEGTNVLLSLLGLERLNFLLARSAKHIENNVQLVLVTPCLQPAARKVTKAREHALVALYATPKQMAGTSRLRQCPDPAC